MRAAPANERRARARYHRSMTSTTPPASLPFTGDPEADALLAADPLALLIGFVLDQQVTVQKAFAGPLELRRRVGTLDPAAIAAMDPEALQAVFRERPALHRFPGAMATRVQELCAVVERLRRRRLAGLGGGPRRSRPRRSPPCAAGDRRDEGQDARRAPREALRRPAARLGGRRPDLPDAGRRRFGRGARPLPGAEARLEGEPEGRARARRSRRRQAGGMADDVADDSRSESGSPSALHNRRSGRALLHSPGPD